MPPQTRRVWWWSPGHLHSQPRNLSSYDHLGPGLCRSKLSARLCLWVVGWVPWISKMGATTIAATTYLWPLVCGAFCLIGSTRYSSIEPLRSGDSSQILDYTTFFWVVCHSTWNNSYLCLKENRGWKNKKNKTSQSGNLWHHLWSVSSTYIP